MGYTEHDCDVCGSSDAEEILCLRHYTGGQPIHVCRNCGLVYVRPRRSFDEIARTWSDEIFATAEAPSGKAEVFTAARPAIRARLIHVLETVDQEIGLASRAMCDIGAGEGVFLEYAQRLKPGVELFGIEPSPANCQRMDALGIPNFTGTIEQYAASEQVRRDHFDVVTMQWTLECTLDGKAMLHAAWDILKLGGHVVIGTGSRMFVPFKKPLQYYVNDGPQDTHSLRFSYKSLRNMLRVTGFEPVFVNRYIDNDVMCMIGRKVENTATPELEKEDPAAVIDFFERWHADSQAHYADWIET